MYDHSASTTSPAAKPSRLRRIFSALVFIVIGSGITFLATNYYYTEQAGQRCKVAYNEGILKGQQELLSDQQKSVQQAGTKILSAMPN